MNWGQGVAPGDSNEPIEPRVSNETSQEPTPAPASATRHADQHFLARTVAVVALTIAVAGLGFITGHYIDAPAISSSQSPRLTLPNFPSSSGNSPSLPGYPGFSGFAPSTPPTGNSASDAAAAKIARAVDPGLVDLSTTLSYQNSAAEGTGMILTSNGLVLTNNHVIAGATAITARDVASGTTYRATVVGYDVKDDVALLQLADASGLATVTTGDSDKVATGDKIVGIGNAGGVGGTPSFAAGEVLALNQSVTASDDTNPAGAEQLHGLIRMSANIQPGDSGGPLVNEQGQVVGIDTAGSQANGGFGYLSSGSSDVQGFAIPINTAVKVVKAIENGDVSSSVHVGATPFLGVEIAATGSAGSSTTGASVAEAIPGESAADAGIVAGDVINSLNGTTITTAASLQGVLFTLRAGQRVTVGYLAANGVAKTVTLTLGTGPAQ